jgi:group I intron endonuclease
MKQSSNGVRTPYLSGIYQIKNSVNNKIYIGSSINLKQRFNDHKKLLRYNKHPNQHLQSSWTKYGESNFEFKILELTPINLLLTKEQSYIDLLLSHDRVIGYNISKTAGNTLGTKRTDSSKLKMSLARVKSDRVANLTNLSVNSDDPYATKTINMGKNNKKSKPVLQCDISNNIIKEWDSAGVAARTLKLSVGNIWMCCNGNYKTSYGFIWKYKNNS